MRILVTGPTGFVGARIMAEFDNAIPCRSLREDNEASIKRLVDHVEPDVIIHTAAISDIATCERLPDASYHANVEIPVWLAGTGVKTVIFSSDQVYSGCTGNGPYPENEVEPANLYARQKLEMEKRTLEINPDTVLLRATWMYDMPIYGLPNRGNFFVNMLCKPELAFSETQYRGLSYVREVAKLMRKAILLPGGVYNYGSENDLDMMKTADWLKERLVLPVRLREAGPKHNLWMDCSKTRDFGICFKNTIGGLEQCIQDYGF